MSIQQALNQLVAGENLSAPSMEGVMRSIMQGEATPAQIAALLVALRMKGETVTEIAAAARVMRELALKVKVDNVNAIDIVGTGGDGASIFNVSTASSFVAAAAGATVAKHGNRSVSSKSGAADVLEAAGANLNLNADQVGRCIADCGVGFMFAPQHHGAMKHAVGPRREIGLRTMFNLLGPLTNPALVTRQILGVFDAKWLVPLAEVMRELGSTHVLVVHSDDGLDELSIAANSQVAELRDGKIESYSVSPKDLDVEMHSIDALKVADAAQSLTLVRQALAHQLGAATEIIALNAGAAIYISGLAATISGGVIQARVVMRNGAASAKFQQFIQTSQAL